MATTNTSQKTRTDGSAESADPVLALSVPTPAPSPLLNPSFQKQEARRSLADRRAHHPEAITIPPASPSPSELSTIKLEDLTSLSHTPGGASELPLRPRGPNTKSPRVLLHTNTFRWVKMEDGVWVKVKRHRIVIVRK